MTTESPSDSQFKSCCADFYADEAVRRILGDSFHPGGASLTRELLRTVGLRSTDHLLDIAAGQGTSTVLAAREFGSRVVAVDLSAANLERCMETARRSGVGDRVTARAADAERIDLPASSFDVVLCECAFCTFVDKPAAAREMARLLRPGGRLALSDMALRRADFPADLQTLLLRVACIADALPADVMSSLLADAGFSELRVEDASWALAEMVQQIQKRLRAADLMQRLGKVHLGGVDLVEGKRLVKRSLELIHDGVVRYVTIVGRMPKSLLREPLGSGSK